MTGVMFDLWAPLAYKADLSAQHRVGRWVPAEHVRRRAAYDVLSAYLTNQARELLPADLEQRERAVERFREYGDPHLLVETLRVAVIGRDARLVCDDAAGDPPAEPEPPEGWTLDEGGNLVQPETTGVAAVADAAQLASWRSEHDDWLVAMAQRSAAVAQQEALDVWSDREHFTRKMIRGERHAGGYGTGVYVLGHDPEAGAGRVRLRVYEPDAFYPESSEDDDPDGMPDRVHLAWEVERSRPGPRGVIRELGVRRITFELVRNEDREPGDQISARPAYTDVEPGVRCLMSDGWWPFDTLVGDVDLYTLPDAGAVWAVDADGAQIRRWDTGLDFVPVVDVPNTITDERWGEPTLLHALQAVDDLQGTDSDVATQAEFAVSPPIVIEGVTINGGQPIEIGPRMAFGVQQGGNVHSIDTSHTLATGHVQVEHLRSRIETVLRIPGEMLGRVKSSDVASGFLMLVAFGPFISTVMEMRLAREAKYRLLAKMVQRISLVHGVEGWAQPVPAGLEFGSFLPSDLATLIDQIVRLHGEGLISRETATRLLVAAGMDVGSIAEELDRIREEDFAGAQALADALGSEQAAADYLGRETAPAVPPVAGIPVVPSPPVR